MLTKKELIQNKINYECREMYTNAIRELMYTDSELKELNGKGLKGKRLNSCTAWVFETKNFYILKSYETYIAVIDKDNDVLYDVLRIVYGYTATSAQHITKFGNQYGRGKWGVTRKLTARQKSMK